MKGLSWPAVAVFAVAVTGFIVMYLFVPTDDPMRGALVVAFNGVVTALLAIAIGRRQHDAETKIDKVIEQTNGHDQRPTGDDNGPTGE